MIGRRYLRISVLLGGVLLEAAAPLAAQATPKPPRFQNQIEAYLAKDKDQPPPQDGILFIGSSILRQWTTLSEQMLPLPAFNRAFGGSRTHEVLHYMDRIVLPYRPRIIVYYCGSNDVNGGEPADSIAARFRQFVVRVHTVQPATQVFYVSVNRAPQKRDRWAVVDSVNRAVRAYADTEPLVEFLDVNPALSGPDGQPLPAMFRPDSLHLTPAAYEAFTRVIKPAHERAWSGR